MNIIDRATRSDVLKLGIELIRLERVDGKSIYRIAMSKSSKTSLFPDVDYVYENPKTPYVLEDLGLATLKIYELPGLPHSIANGMPQGDYFVEVDFEKLSEWVDAQLSHASIEAVAVFPEGRDYLYSGQTLYLKTAHGTPCTLDLSKAPTLRPVFESFFYIFDNTGNKTVSTQDVLVNYKHLTGHEITWRMLIKRKSSIVGKMINPKQCLSNRLIWEYDNDKKQYRFEILPLSDDLSDKIAS